MSVKSSISIVHSQEKRDEKDFAGSRIPGFAHVGMCSPCCTGSRAGELLPEASAAATEAPAEAVAATEAPAEAAAPAEFKLADRIAQKVANGEPLVFRVSYHDVSNQFAPFMKLGVEQAAKEFGVDVKMVGPVGPDADARDQRARDAGRGRCGWPCHLLCKLRHAAPVIDRLIEQGIPVVAYNTDNPVSYRLAFAGQDLEQSGYEAAKTLSELLGGEGDVIITTLAPAAQWSIDREAGARHGFADFPGIKVLQTVNAAARSRRRSTPILRMPCSGQPMGHRHPLARVLLPAACG